MENVTVETVPSRDKADYTFGIRLEVGMAPDLESARRRWVFGDYIVYAHDQYLARQIFEKVLAEAASDERFGVVTLPNGTGNWVQVGRCRNKPDRPEDQ